MRKTAVCILVLLCSLGAYAATISSISPSSVAVSSGEYFLTVFGSGLGDQVIYTGPAGTFTIAINSRDLSSVTAWIPLDVVNRGGTYSVVVRGSNGDSNPATFTVTGGVKRFTLLLPDTLVFSASSREGTRVKFDLTTDGGDETPTINCDPKSDSTFKMGTTNVRCVATSGREQAEGNFFVTVVDDGAPVLKLPKDIVTDASDSTGTSVKFDVSAVDAIDGSLRVTCNRESGSLFAVGTTPVVCSAADLSSNLAQGTFRVTVKGKGQLALRVPDGFVVEADGPETTIVDYDGLVSAYGSEDPYPKVKCDPASGSRFKFGTTLVTCSAEDRFGSKAEARFELTVADTIGPALSALFAKTEYLVPVDGSMVPVTIVVEPIDLVDPFPRCSIVDVTANETISPEDWKILSSNEVSLRATRSGKIDRVYRVNVSCVDERKNESKGVANVIVPASGEAPKGGSLSPVTGRRRPSGR